MHGSECLWLNLFQSFTEKKLVIATIYRHPGAKVDKFFEDYSQCLEQSLIEKKIFYILCDININKNSSQDVNYRNATESNGAFQLFTQPTRVTHSTATVIDHIITNDKIHKLCSYVLPVNLTDHYPTICLIDNLTIIKNNPKNVPRDGKFFNSQIFCDELKEKLGELVSNNLPLNHAIFNSVFDEFVSQITEMIDRHAPFKRLSRKQKIGKKP